MNTERLDRFTEQLATLSLREVSLLKSALDELALTLVLQRRRDGATWKQIADELGVSMQEAHRKYAVLARNGRERSVLHPRFSDDF